MAAAAVTVDQVDEERPGGARMWSEKDVADGVAFLLDAASDFVTGQHLRVDGGFHTQ